MKCVECHKNFTGKRNDAKFCSDNCRVNHHNRQKKRQEQLNNDTKSALGQTKKITTVKSKDLSEQIQSHSLAIKQLKEGVTNLNYDKKITLTGAKNIQYDIAALQTQIKPLEAVLKLDDETFYQNYCTNQEVNVENLGFILNGILNLTLLPYNIDEREKEIKKVKVQVQEKLTELIVKQLDKKQELNNTFKELEEISYYIQQTKKEIEERQQKIVQLKKELQNEQKLKQQKSIPHQSVKNSNRTNGVSGAELLNMTFNTFLLDGELGSFLGELDRNMTAFALTGDSGAGKSYFSFELAKAFIDNGYKAKYFALEEGLGKLTQDKVRYYGLDDNLTITGNGTLREVRRDAKNYDLIVIDSFQKLNVKAEEFERLRQDFPKTIFIIIFQKTSSGTIRGGSSIKFNSSATIDVQLQDGERIAVMEKGRYGTIGWVYSIDEGRVIEK